MSKERVFSSSLLRHSALAALVALGGLAATPGAWAAKPMQYDNAEPAASSCMQESRATCMREMAAARQVARSGGLTHPTNDYEKNALARCQLQQPADRPACEQRVLGTGQTTIDGSVAGGGIIMETVTPVPATSR